MSGLDRIEAAFHLSRGAGRAALMPYFTLGYPDIESSIEIIEAIAKAGADLIELGIPFSDPLADGPTIQHSTQVALEAGMTVEACLRSVERLRAGGVEVPLILMGYVNPILTYGIEPFVIDAAAAGADGLIVPDLPPEEAAELKAASGEHGLALIHMLAPTSTPERLKAVLERAVGFVYLVSLIGVTGARAELPAELAEFVERVRALTSTPLAVGFGVSTLSQAAAVGALADGVIVGSALIDAANAADDPPQAAAGFVAELRRALQSAQAEAAGS